MTNITPSTLLVLAALSVLSILFFATPKAPFEWHRRLGYLSLSLGAASGIFLLAVGSSAAWQGAWRAAAEQFLMLYVVLTASWLAWKASRPF